jgi:hypothetical protein
MPTFCNRIPTLNKVQGYDLKRTPATQAIIAIITCDELVACQTHYWGGRTVPCEGTECKACLNLVPARWHIYVTCMEEKSRAQYIFECTAQAGEAFSEHFNAHGTLRGCKFQAYRPKQTKNGKVQIETKPYDLTKINLPPAPNLKRALCTIWQLPAGTVDTETGETKVVMPKKNGKAIKAMREQPSNAPDPLTMRDLLKEVPQLKES